MFVGSIWCIVLFKPAFFGFCLGDVSVEESGRCSPLHYHIAVIISSVLLIFATSLGAPLLDASSFFKIYLFASGAVLGLCFCAQALPSCGE